MRKNNIKGYVHASYLLNFCKIPVGLLRIQWAYNMLKEDMELAEYWFDKAQKNPFKSMEIPFGLKRTKVGL